MKLNYKRVPIGAWGLFGLIFSCFSCLDEVNVLLRQESEKLVLEGLLSNEPNGHFLRISLTTQFGDAGTIVPVKGAFVEIRSDKGNNTWRPIPSEIGLYKPDNQQFTGITNNQYSIYIKLPDGREYQSAPQKMPTSVPIQKLDTTFVKGRQIGYQINLDFKDPSETENYYRWAAKSYYQRKSTGVPVGFGTAVCCDRCWVLNEGSGINIFSDAISNGAMVRVRPVLFTPFYTTGNNLIEVKQYAISLNTYQFWQRFQEQQQRTGSIFDPLPAPLLGNVVNINDPSDIAIGYFEVSAVSKRRLEFMAFPPNAFITNFSQPAYIPNGDCMLAYPYSVYIVNTPSGW